MTIIKKYIGPLLIILAASAIVVLASLPVGKTEWAEGFRSEFSERRPPEGIEEGEHPERPDGPSGVLMLVGPLIKVFILMGIGGLLTAFVLWIIGLVSGQKPSLQKNNEF